MTETAERTQAEIDAEIAKSTAEAEKAKAEAAKLRAEASAAEIALAKALRAEQAELATDENNHVYQFTVGVDANSVSKAIAKLSEWHRVDPDCDIEIRFYSPGGSVLAGFNLFDHIVWLRNNGHNVTTVATGLAASMAGILLQAGTTRVIGKESILHLHEISTLASGKIGELEDELQFVKKMQARVLDIFAERAKISKARIKALYRRQEAYLSSADALKLGFVDEIR